MPLMALHSPSRTTSAAPGAARNPARDRRAPLHSGLPWGSPPLRRARSGGSCSRRGPADPTTMNHRRSVRDATDCSAPPTPRLGTGFHARAAPPTPFPTTLTARSPPDSVESSIHSRPWGSGSLLPSGRRRLLRVAPRRGVGWFEVQATRPPLQPPRCLVRLRFPGRSRSRRLSHRPRASRPGWLLGPVSDRPCACYRVRGVGPTGVGSAAPPPEGGDPSAPLRPRPRRLSTTRPRTSSGLLRPLPCPVRFAPLPKRSCVPS
jgi:hypothetical protein